MNDKEKVKELEKAMDILRKKPDRVIDVNTIEVGKGETLTISIPPRYGKSRMTKLFYEWLNDQLRLKELEEEPNADKGIEICTIRRVNE